MKHYFKGICSLLVLLSLTMNTAAHAAAPTESAAEFSKSAAEFSKNAAEFGKTAAEFAGSTADTAGSADFVTVRDGRFYLGAKEYRYVGANLWYGAILASEGRGGNRERLHRELDHLKAIGVDNVRVLVGGDGREGIPSHIAPKLQTEPGVYNDTLLAGLDYLMVELEKRDMRAVLYLNNAWEWSGGYGAYLDWAGFSADIADHTKGDGSKRHFATTPVPSIDGWREYMDYVSNFVLHEGAMAMADRHACYVVSRRNRYTGQPYSACKALMAWEIANEPRAFAADDLHKRKFVEWIDRQSRLIRAIDPNHLITTGSEGRHGCEQDMALFRTIHTLPCIDYACIHIWPYNWGWLGRFEQNADGGKTIPEHRPDPMTERIGEACERSLAYIDEAAAALQGSGRPIVLEEFGYPRDRFRFDAGSPTTGRDRYYRFLFSIIRDSGKIAGCNFWGWGGSADVKHVVWQRWDDYVGDPAQEEQGLNSVFAADASTLSVIRTMASEITK